MRKKLYWSLGIAAAIFLLIMLFNSRSPVFIGKFLLGVSKQTFGFNINETNPAVCEKLSNTAAKDTCYNIVADNRNDVSICEKIMGQNQKSVCLKGFNMKK